MLDKRMWAGAFLATALAGAAAAAAEKPACSVRVASVDAAQVATFRAECRWRVAPRFVTALLTDPPRMAAISSSLEESRRLPDGRLLNVQRAGWPMDDRQSTLAVSDEPLPGGGIRRSFRLASVQEPTREGRVQVSVDEGSWLVSAAPGGGTRLELTMRYEPGGNMPPSLVHKMSPERIARSLEELRVAAEAMARGPAANADVASGPPSGR